jgi:hypothetical protein
MESIPQVKIKGMVTVTVKIKGMVTVTVKIKGMVTVTVKITGMVTVTVKIKGMVKGRLPTGNRSRNPHQRNQQPHACYNCLPFPCNRGKHKTRTAGACKIADARFHIGRLKMFAEKRISIGIWGSASTCGGVLFTRGQKKVFSISL